MSLFIHKLKKHACDIVLCLLLMMVWPSLQHRYMLCFLGLEVCRAHECNHDASVVLISYPMHEVMPGPISRFTLNVGIGHRSV